MEESLRQNTTATQNKQLEELGNAKINKLLFKLAFPAITAQIVNLLYMLVDRVYIGHMDAVGAAALTGMGVCMPLLMIITAFASLASMGGASRASILLGEGDRVSAESTLGNCTTVLIILSIVLTIVYEVFGKQLLLLFGASENTVSYAWEYLEVYSIGTIFVQLTLGLNAFITTQGFAKTSMLTVIIGAIINIVLDPVFIFVFKMGVKGAAIATVISQAVSAIWVVVFLCGKKTVLRLKLKNLILDKKIILPCLALGLSPFVMQATESIIGVCFNSSLLKYGGDIAVGTMTILLSVMQFAMLPLMGLTQGAQPIISYNFGARNIKRVKDTFKALLIASVGFSTAIWAFAMITPSTLAKIFTSSPELIKYTSWALRIYISVACIFGAQIACQQTFIAIGNAKASLFLAILRKIILLIPLIYIMPEIIVGNKALGVFLAEPISDFIAVVTTVIMFAVIFKKTLKKMEPAEIEPISENLIVTKSDEGANNE